MAANLSWAISLTLIAAVAVAFGAVAAASGKARAVDRPYRWRPAAFVIIAVAFVAVTWATLTPWPIEAYAARASAEPARVIRATAHQWRWELSGDTVRVGETVEFHVTAGDVNHGFALYKDRNHLVAQTQAMPGYTNRLRVRFDSPGEYEVLCLEYCGLGHHRMAARLRVVF